MENSNLQESGNKRSGLLTTMCILTGVWGGLSVIIGLVGLANPFANVGKSSIDIIANLGSIVGAIMMWKMNRTGLWIYLACELIPYITSIAFVGINAIAMSVSFLGGWVSSMVMVVLALMIIIDAVFAYLYHLGLKKSGK